MYILKYKVIYKYTQDMRIYTAGHGHLYCRTRLLTYKVRVFIHKARSFIHKVR